MSALCAAGQLSAWRESSLEQPADTLVVHAPACLQRLVQLLKERDVERQARLAACAGALHLQQQHLKDTAAAGSAAASSKAAAGGVPHSKQGPRPDGSSSSREDTAERVLQQLLPSSGAAAAAAIAAAGAPSKASRALLAEVRHPEGLFAVHVCWLTHTRPPGFGLRLPVVSALALLLRRRMLCPTCCSSWLVRMKTCRRHSLMSSRQQQLRSQKLGPGSGQAAHCLACNQQQARRPRAHPCSQQQLLLTTAAAAAGGPHAQGWCKTSSRSDGQRQRCCCQGG